MRAARGGCSLAKRSFEAEGIEKRGCKGVVVVVARIYALAAFMPLPANTHTPS
jgi:hypothetical protein